MNAQLTETAPVPVNQPSPITVNDILARYERECLHELAESTQRDYRYHISYLRRDFGQLIATELEPRTFAEYLGPRPKGRARRVRTLAVLSGALMIAVRRWFWLRSNCLRDVERPHPKPRTRLIRDDEFHACKAMAPLRVRLAMELALLTGQRQGDIIRFRWKDLRDVVVPDPEHPGQMKHVAILHVLQSKTGKRLGIRVKPDLEELLDRCWSLEGGGKDGSEYVLPSDETGKPYTSAAFRSAWQRVRLKWERLGRENFHFHDIRSLAATKCATLEEARALLGHTTSAMTRRVYSRGIEMVEPLAMSVVSNH